MKDEQAVDQHKRKQDKHKKHEHQKNDHGHPKHVGGGNGDLIYLLGAIGAGVYYWKRADEPQDKALGALKALVWPATLVYEALSRLDVD